MDIHLVNSGNFQNPNAPNALYRNSGNDTFTDLTKEARIGNTGFGSGVYVGDYDNDGGLDLVVTNYQSQV